MEAEQKIEKSISLFSRLPKGLRITLIILSIITIIYWVLWLSFKIWKYTGKALHWISDPRNWWIYTSVILILVIGGLILAQFFSDIKPFTHLWNYIVGLFEKIKGRVIKMID